MERRMIPNMADNGKMILSLTDTELWWERKMDPYIKEYFRIEFLYMVLLLSWVEKISNSILDCTIKM